MPKSLPLELILEILSYRSIDARGDGGKFAALSRVCKVSKLVLHRIFSNYLWGRHGQHTSNTYCFVMYELSLQKQPKAFWKLHVLTMPMGSTSNL
jgi:hypothetical protein